MKIGKWIIAGGIGGAVAAGIWTAIAYSTGYEIGWIAWFVGVVVGFCVRVAAGEEEGYAPGLTAVAIAVLALVIGKYATVSLLVDRELGAKIAEMPRVTADNFQLELCSEVAEEWTAAKKKMKWLPGKSAEVAQELQDYPQAVRDEAKKRWDAKPAAEQQELIAARQEMMEEFTSSLAAGVKTQVFKASFNGYDILFFILAIVSAFKVGSGMSSNES